MINGRKQRNELTVSPNYTLAPDATFNHAVVIGGGIAGFTAARVLSDHFAHVTVVERDHLPDAPVRRHGVPQARHAHNLLPEGQKILEALFPGLVDELLARGAVAMREGEQALFIAGREQEWPRRGLDVWIAASRPLLETAIYRRVDVHPRIHVLQGYEATGLSVSEDGRRVSGVLLRSRDSAHPTRTELAAELVVDASGRRSKATHWLAGLGYAPPSETTVDAFAGYASRIYRRPDGFEGTWKALYVRPHRRTGTRGGIIIPLEGNRWHVTLIGMARDYPPTDEEAFLAFARSLPTAELYEAIKEAEPLTKPFGYRSTGNRLRHYEALPDYLEGFLMTGDAVYTMNPVYAQGMTLAAIAAQTLQQVLEAQRMRTDLTGLAERFQKELWQAVAGQWRQATMEDRRWPGTVVLDGERPDGGRARSGPAAGARFPVRVPSWQPAAASVRPRAR
ncbi:MAG: FAD-dependent monooxygenase [Candidatus Promineifilaceae bacterium]|nr:FAD-dependent monooxygenase [Candidatus Promineifilaceae bacterium]